ncbi:MAG: acetate/propionate family kinase [Planctomycetaceae bacterium]|nr:acetate/propionate family kinase [Planctomycetaceae bacterium]
MKKAEEHPGMKKIILVLNTGSSSVKFSVFSVGDGELHLLSRGELEGIGTAPHFFATEDGARVADANFSAEEVATQEDALHHIFDWLKGHCAGLEIMAVGHRVVHGGPVYAEPVVVDERVLEVLTGFEPLAPSHQPHNLASIRALAKARPDLPQVACFDTAFHRTAPKVAELYALPRDLYDAGVRRYGFHGLSYEFVAHALRALDPVAAAGRLVIAHLGNGCSMAAILAGKSLGNTMGLTALDGLPMGTRCGQIDPGVLIYLMQQRGMSLDRVEDLLYNHSGLKGLSGVSNDMRYLLASDQPDARLAVDYFVDRIGRALGSLAAVLKGLDALVFTAGIGENAVEVRARVCCDAAWLGVTLDDEANHRGGPRISKGGRVPSVWVIPTNEELMIAQHTLRLISRLRLGGHQGSDPGVL